MGWTGLVLASAVFLALYDLCKKASVRDNAVMSVLLGSTCCGCAAFVAALAVCGRLGEVVAADAATVLLAAAKSLIVAISWIFTFTALRSLPITIATPIRASSPALVFVVALFVYGETPSWLQALGMALVFAGYFAFSWAGRAEGIDFFRNRAVWCAIAGAVFSAASALFDKFVFQLTDAKTEAVQFYFQVGLVVVYALALVFSRAVGVCQRFEWRWTIPLVGILLAAADWLYFTALDVPGAPVSVVALMRRFSVVITFALGAVFFRESNLRRKGLALAAVLTGIVLLVLNR